MIPQDAITVQPKVFTVSGREAETPWTLSPSDLTFLISECPRCLWMKIKGGIPRPSSPFPRIFGLLDSQVKECFAPLRTEDIHPGLPPGRVFCSDRSVRSRPIEVGSHERPVVFRGRLDTVFAFDDGTFAVVDYKTTEPKPHHVGFYGRQLHAYSIATERAAKGSLELAKVSFMGLLCAEPVGMSSHEEGVAYYCQMHLIEVPRDDEAFLEFVSGALYILERDEPPDPSPECGFCRYLAAGSLALLTGIYKT